MNKVNKYILKVKGQFHNYYVLLKLLWHRPDWNRGEERDCTFSVSVDAELQYLVSMRMRVRVTRTFVASLQSELVLRANHVNKKLWQLFITPLYLSL